MSLAGIALVLVLGGSLVQPQPALAGPGTITVDELNCTLADAITTANTGTNTNGCTGGTLSNDIIYLGTDVALTGAPLPVVSSDITIEGINHKIAGNDTFRILEVGATGNLTLNQATISGGSAPQGGGIYNGGTLAVNNSTITGNTAIFDGGGIYNDGNSTITITNSTVSGNSASIGGGIYNSGGTVTISNSTISGNSAGAGNGGGIYNRSGTLTIENGSTIEDGYASQSGGGIFNDGTSTITITNSTISSNSANNIGGGIANSGGLTVQGSTLSGNSAPTGGGIRNTGPLTVQDSTLIDNSANWGGGIDNSGDLTVQGSTLSGNSAGIGGGIQTSSTTTIINSTLSGNTASSDGGGIYSSYARLTVQNSTITGNSASSDGGGIFGYYGSVFMQNSIIALQTAGENCYFYDSSDATTQGYNIDSDGTCGFTGTGDQENVPAAALNLYSLADNGGPTLTHGIGPSSAALDQIPAANCLELTTDQRGAGFGRPVDYGSDDAAAMCDVGAFELQNGETPNVITLENFAAQGSDRPPSVGGLLAAGSLLAASSLLAAGKLLTGRGWRRRR